MGRSRDPPLAWLEGLIWAWLALLLRSAWRLCRAALRLAALLLGLAWAVARPAVCTALAGLWGGRAGGRQGRRRTPGRRTKRRR